MLLRISIQELRLLNLIFPIFINTNTELGYLAPFSIFILTPFVFWTSDQNHRCPNNTY